MASSSRRNGSPSYLKSNPNKSEAVICLNLFELSPNKSEAVIRLNLFELNPDKSEAVICLGFHG